MLFIHNKGYTNKEFTIHENIINSISFLIKFLIECELFPPFHIFIVFYPLPGWEYSWDWVTSQCQWWPPATSEAACCHSFRGWTFQLTTLLTLHLHNTIFSVLSQASKPTQLFSKFHFPVFDNIWYECGMCII